MVMTIIHLCKCFIVFIIVSVTLINGINLITVSFKSANAQSNTKFKLEHAQHMICHGGHMMMCQGPQHQMMLQNKMIQQMLQNEPNNNYNNPSIIQTKNITDNKKPVIVSIVSGAASLTTNSYQPNPLYIKAGQTVIWTNNDNIVHTVTQSAYSSLGGSNKGNNNNNIVTMGFDSGVLNIGESVFQKFDKEGIYDYYCTIHPWMIGKVVVSPANSNSTHTTASTITAVLGKQ